MPEPSSSTVSYRSDDVDQVMLLGRKPIKSGSPSVAPVQTTTYNESVGDLIVHAHSVSTGPSRSSDDAQSLSLDDHFGFIGGVRPDCEQQQLY